MRDVRGEASQRILHVRRISTHLCYRVHVTAVCNEMNVLSPLLALFPLMRAAHNLGQRRTERRTPMLSLTRASLLPACSQSRFVYPVRGSDSSVMLLDFCGVPKAGMSSMYQLLLRAASGRFGPGFDTFRGGATDTHRLLGALTGSLRCNRWVQSNTTAALRFVITRDPYARLLSGYLNKVVRYPRVMAGEGRPATMRFRAPSGGQNWSATPADFAAFVAGLDKWSNQSKKRRGPVGDSVAQLHLLPFVDLPISCLPPLGSRSVDALEAHALNVFKLEEMQAWYPVLVHAVPGLAEAANDPAWAMHGRPNPCYWAAHKQTCQQSRRQPDPSQQSGADRTAEGPSSQSCGTAVSSYHTTSACSKLRQFYGSSPEVLAAANRYLRDDLEALDYPELRI